MTTSTIPALLAVFATILAVASAGKSELFLYDDVPSANPTITGVPMGPAQRCYVITCEDFKPSYVAWNNIQMQSWIVFFKDTKCRGKYVKARGPDGSIKLAGTDYDKSVSSVMIWESGVFATRGFEESCDERAVVGNNSVGVIGGAFNWSYTGEYGDTDTW